MTVTGVGCGVRVLSLSLLATPSTLALTQAEACDYQNPPDIFRWTGYYES